MNPTLRHRAPLLSGVLVLACAAAAPARAQTSPYYIGILQSIGYESNLLGLANGQPTPPGYNKSDTLYTTSLLAGLNQPIGRQRVYGSLSYRITRYSDNSIYDNNGYALSGGLDWSTINRISGTVTASANRSLSSFGLTEVGLLPQKNLETSETLNATVAVGMVTEYTFEGAAGLRRVRNSLDNSSIRSRDYDQATASAGVRWRPSDGANFGAALRGSKGTYPRFRRNPDGSDVEDRFTRQDIDFTANLIPRGLSTYDARISIGKTTYDLNEQRDFSGLTGSVGWLYVPSAKLRFSTRLSRDTGQDSYAVAVFNSAAVSEYSQTTTSLSVRADYSATAKISVNGTFQYADSKLVRTIDNPFVPLNAQGRDRTTYLTLGVRWAVLRNGQLGCNAGTTDRSSSGQLSADLKNSSFSCYGQLTLQ